MSARAGFDFEGRTVDVAKRAHGSRNAQRARAQERQSWWKASSSPLEPSQLRQSPRADQKGKIMPSLVKRHEKLKAVRKKLAAKPAEKN